MEKNIEENFLILNEVNEESSLKKKDFLDVLKMFAPGTSLRSALDDLLRARMGALIVVDVKGLSEISEKGFWINSKFTSQKLVELAKMDGAIILSKNIKRILYANTLLSPDQKILTKETGTRHKAAERTAKQVFTITIAISERKNKVSIYYRDQKHELSPTSEILRRATENLQILEKQRDDFDELLSKLNVLEFRKAVTIRDVCLVLQRVEIIKRISEVVKRYLVELGKEGIVVSMRLRELTANLEKEEEFVLRDYFGPENNKVEVVLKKMDFEFLLDPSNIFNELFEEIPDTKIYSRGIRILNKTNLTERYIDSLVGKFKTFDKILGASESDLEIVFENEGLVEFFKSEIYHLKSKILSREFL